jgi:hypothetical protein
VTRPPRTASIRARSNADWFSFTGTAPQETPGRARTGFKPSGTLRGDEPVQDILNPDSGFDKHTGPNVLRAKALLVFMTLIVSSLLGTLLVTNVQAAGCSPNCDFETNTNVPASEGTVHVKIDGAGSFTLNQTFTFTNNTSHTIEVIETLISSPSGARYVFKQWSHNGSPWSPSPTLSGNPLDPIVADFVTGGNGPFVAEFEKQFQASFSFTDPLGQAISRPSSITLQGPRTVSIPNNSSAFQNLWYAASVWTVTDATWQSMPDMVDGTQTVDLTSGPVSRQIRLRAYTATVKVVDRLNNPISGVSLFVRLTNQTSTELPFTTDAQGLAQLGYIPLGSYTVRVVFQNQDMGSWVVEASQTPVNTISLNVGGTTSGPIISAVVLLTIFGVAMFLLLLAVKVRKPPLPPTI